MAWGTSAGEHFLASNPVSALAAAVSIPSGGTTIPGGTLAVGQFKATAIDTESGSNLVVGDGSSVTQVPILNWYAANGAWQIAIDVANTPFARDLVLAAKFNVRATVLDGVTTLNSTTVTSATAPFLVGDVGQLIRGKGIPWNTTIASRQSASSITLSQAATATNSGLYLEIGAAGVSDFIYVSGFGAGAPAVGFNVTPPVGTYAVEMSGPDNGTQGVLSIRRPPGNTAKLLNFHDSVPTDQLWVDSSYMLASVPAGPGVQFRAEATNQKVMTMAKSDATTTYGFLYNGNSMDFKYFGGGVVIWEANTDGSLGIIGKIGFNNTAPITKPTVTGAKGSNAALGSLMTALANYGLVVDSTTA